MSKEGVDLFRQCIHKGFCLPREGREWLLQDHWVLKLKTPQRYSLGFRLDKKVLVDPKSFDESGVDSPSETRLDKKVPLLPFGFFSGSPPGDVAKMCDAIIVLSYKGGLYIFLVEQKTSKKDEYRKQLKNGKYFCDWLLALLEGHDHYKGKPVFIGLLCMRPLFPSKEITARENNDGIEKIEDKMMPFELYKAIDRETIHLTELIGNA